MDNPLFQNGHALLIGVGDNLPASIRDATALYLFLTDPKRGAYPIRQTQLLVGKGASRKSILNALDQLSNIDSLEDSTVVIYYSGQGGKANKKMISSDEEHYIIADGFDQTKNTCILDQEFADRISQITASKVLIILDCDYGEGFSRNIILRENLIILVSCQQNENSFSSETQSFFTECLIEVLELKNSVNTSSSIVDFIDFHLVIRYLNDQVPQRVLQYNKGPQNPHYSVSRLMGNFAICNAPENKRSYSIRSEADFFADLAKEEKIKILRKRLNSNLKKLAEYNDKIVQLSSGTPENFRLAAEILDVEREIDQIQDKIRDLK